MGFRNAVLKVNATASIIPRIIILFIANRFVVFLFVLLVSVLLVSLPGSLVYIVN